MMNGINKVEYFRQKCFQKWIESGWNRIRPIAASLLISGIALNLLVPFATQVRGYPAFGGEYLVIAVAFLLPWIFLSRD